MSEPGTPTAPALPARVVLGGYSLDPQGDAVAAGTGLRVLDRRGGVLEAPRYAVVGQEALLSPTWVVAHATRPWLVSVSEAAPSELVCLRVEDDGGLTVLGRCTTGGDSGCHPALSADGRQVVVAHYGSGTVESFALDDDGGITGPLDRFVPSDPLGPDVERQEGPHAHQVVLDPGRPGEVLVCDLGSDRVHRLRLHPDGRLTVAAPGLVLPPGFGPRHLVVAEETLVVAGELSVALWVGRRAADGWRQTQVVPTTTRTGSERDPGDAPVAPSALRCAGDQVVVATRGVDTLSVFALERARSTVELVAEVACGGEHPRDLVVADGLIWVANQWSDEVVVLDLDAVGAGREEAAVQRIATPQPACVVLLGTQTRTTGTR